MSYNASEFVSALADLCELKVRTGFSMASDSALIDQLKKIAEAVAATVGPNCEVSVSDLKSCELVAVENGQVTDRAVGDPIDPGVAAYFKRHRGDASQFLNYASKSLVNGKLLKCSTVVIQDETGEPVATFSINLDLVAEGAETPLDADGSADRGETSKMLPEGSSENFETVEDYTQYLLDSTLRFFNEYVGKPLKLATKEDKLAVIDTLNKKGVFQIRDTAPAVCDMLSISQATFYNYLREVKRRGEK